ncbi:MAG TPA: nucleotidyltransferase family protein [Roseiflexaceae bacterium]|jgi:hypothetical protein|nr:nucleotidyltransferase family protein [Roseiflexaceae bacterium]
MSLIAGNLGVVQRLLDAQQATWAVCAGAAAHLYGNRRPIQDIDILVTPGQLPLVVQLLQRQQKAVQFDGQRILWRGIKVFDNLSIKRGSATYPFNLDELAQARLRRIPLLGAQVSVLAPEDVLLHKVLTARGESEGKHDLSDVQGIMRRQQIDLDYLQQRIEAMRAADVAPAALQAIGVMMSAERVGSEG